MNRKKTFKAHLREDVIPKLRARHLYFSIHAIRAELAGRHIEFDPLTLNRYLVELREAGFIHDAGKWWYAHIQTGEYGKAISCLTEYTRRRPDDLSTIMPGKTLRPKVKPLRVEVESPGQRKKTHVFEGGFISVGRSPGLEITIKDDSNVSRFHGLFYYRDALYHYRDLKSTQGSFRGDQRVHHDTPLVGMEAIRVGQTLMRISY